MPLPTTMASKVVGTGGRRRQAGARAETRTRTRTRTGRTEGQSPACRETSTGLAAAGRAAHDPGMRKVVGLVAIAFFFLNPGFACGPAGPEFQFGAPEMRAAVEGDWLVTITPEGGSTLSYHLSLAQAASAPATASRPAGRHLLRAAHACGTRTLVASASA